MKVFKNSILFLMSAVRHRVRHQCLVLACLFGIFDFASQLGAANPIVEGVGLCDPKVRIYDNHAYLYATHDAVPGSKRFIMHDWWVWESDDLVHWKQVSTLKPEQTYYKKPFNECWATDAIRHNGKYYFYFSRGPKEIGVVVGDGPAGPWRDPLGKPFIAAGSTPTIARDPAILQEPDGATYIVFGCWNYYIARLNDDRISLAEKPRKLEVSPMMGPYGPGKLDDKSFLFGYGGRYYLSWGSYYAMSDNIYGPYTYIDDFIHEDRVEPVFQKGMAQADRRGSFFPDRHGSFFQLYNQWYFICNDQSWPGTSACYRDSIISYVHFRDNGEIDPIYINRIGVGEYDARDTIQAEDYFRGEGVIQKESPDGGFEVRNVHEGTELVYPNVMNMPANAKISFRFANGNAESGTIEIHSGSADGPSLGKCKIRRTGGWKNYKTVTCQLNNKQGTLDLYLLFHGREGDLLHFNWFSIKRGI